ncbi:MAG: nuclear transport factor 2 family protein [Bacteroidota bacterium]
MHTLSFRATLLVLAFAFLALPTHAQSTPDSEAEPIWDTVVGVWDAYASGDIDTAMSFYGDWHRWGYHQEDLWDRDDMRQFMVRGTELYTTTETEIEPVHVQVFGDAALAHYIAHVETVNRTSGQTNRQMERHTDFLVREDRQWRIVGGSRDNQCRILAEAERPVLGFICSSSRLAPSLETTLLSDEDRSRYVGTYNEGGETVQVWEEDGILLITAGESSFYDRIQLVPMGNGTFAQGRYEDGELAEIYWPHIRIRFVESNGGIARYELGNGAMVFGIGERVQ